MVDDFSAQRISRLTPLKAVLERIDAQVEAVKPQRWAIATTQGYTLAEDVVSFECPKHPIALRDGFAVAAVAIADASSYAPVPLPQPACRIDVGQALPSGADAVLPLDAVVLRGAHAQAIAAVTAGEGVLPAGGDTALHAILRRTGERMRSVDMAAMHAAGIKSVLVREPRVAVVLGGEPGTRPLDAVLGLLMRAVSAAGATASSSSRDITFDGAVADANNDAIVSVGGTGSGKTDRAVQTLTRLGRVEMHGIAISPGETAAFGFVGQRPVLLIPGRLDAALAVWLLIGQRLVAKLAAGKVEDAPVMMPLKRKVTSTIGMTELIPVRAAGGMAEPLASGYLSFESLARSDGWMIVPAESEGFAAGTPVAVNPWP
jgi:molybdopterin biosynthesis enzyme